MKKLSMLGILILVAMFSFNVKADIITLDGANEIANAFFANSASSQKRALKSAAQLEYAWDSNSLTQTGSSMMKSVEEDPTFYVFNNPDGEGFVIVSGDSNARSVIGYSYEGSVPMADEIPDPMKDYLLGIDEEIKWARTNLTSTGKNLKATLAETGEDREVYLPTPSWDQHEPFNGQCYTNATSSNIGITGCVPIAYAMIMKYHNWPEVGTLGYTNEGGRYELANMYTGVAISNRTYDWNKILFSYSGDYTQEQADEVAKLVSHIGHAFSTDHNKGTSNEGASTKWLNYFFGYNWVDASQQSNFTLEVWKGKIRESLNNGCPIPYAADRSSDSGDLRHMFVLDGYKDIEDVYHFNWGWRGSANGWFSMTAMTSDGRDYSWKDGSDHTAFFNFRPDKTTYSVTATANPSNMGTVSVNMGTAGSTASAEMIDGATATLTAYPADGYALASWTKNGVVVGSKNTIEVKVGTSDNDYVANFDLASNVLVTKDYIIKPSTVELTGSSKVGVVTYKTSEEYPAALSLASTKTDGTSISAMSRNDDEQIKLYAYDQATSSTSVKYTISVPEGYIITEYSFEYSLNLPTYPCSITYSGGTISSPADKGWHSLSPVSVNAQTAEFTMTAEKAHASSSFYIKNFNVTVAKEGGVTPPSGESVSIDLVMSSFGENITYEEIINNCSVFSNDQTAVVGGNIILTAEAKSGYKFDGWYFLDGETPIQISTDNPATITITEDMVINGIVYVIAAFSKDDTPVTPQYTATAVASPTEGGTATVAVEGTNVVFTAEPATDYEFVNWTGTGTSTWGENPLTLPLIADITLTANFREKQGGGDTGDTPLDRTGWTVTASSQEATGEGAGNGVASCIVDNNLNTYWHSDWKTTNPTYPHWFMIDMQSVKSINAFEYVSRGTGTNSDAENNGNIVNYSLYVSETEIDPNNRPEQPTVAGYFTYNSTTNLHKVELGEAVTGRYIMLYATGNSSANGLQYASCVEFYVYGKQAEADEYPQLTNVPTIYINTENGVGVTSKDDYVNAYVTVRGAENEEDNITEVLTEIKGRGNSTWEMAKKPYRLKFDEKINFLGNVAKEKNWVLLANYADKTLMRNALAFETARNKFNFGFTPSVKFVDLVLNGEYLGSYMVTDQVEVKKNRVPVTEQETTVQATDPDITGGYLIEVDGFADSEISWFKTTKEMKVTIKYPKDDEINVAQKDYIKNYTQQMEDALFSSSFTSEETGWRKYIDEASMVDWYIACELFGNSDAWWSTYMYKERNDVFKFGPLWDFDIAFNNDDRLGDATQKLMRTDAHDPKTWIARWWEDEGFQASVKARWAEVRKDGVKEFMINYIDEIEEYLSESQTKNFQRWNILNTKVYRELEARGSYAAEVAFLKNYVTSRINYLDTKFSLDLEYITDFGTSTNADKGALTAINFNIGSNVQTLPTGKTSSAGEIYVDKTDKVITIKAGTQVTSLTTTGSVGNNWMHGYLFVDWNNDKTFTPDLNEWVPTEESELIAYGFWSGQDGDSSHGNVNDNTGYNHLGEVFTGDSRATNGALKEFTIPSDIPAGDYRARYKLDWNCTNPDATLDTNMGAMVVDFTLRIEEPSETPEEYCIPSGNMTNANGRKLNSFTISDGTNSVVVTNIQTSTTDAIYKDKTESVLTTTQGTRLSFSELNWEGSWMHGYVFIDYNNDGEFNQDSNNNGSTTGELVTYSAFNASSGRNFRDINGVITPDTDGSGNNSYDGDGGNGVNVNSMPSWTLPNNLVPGKTYRVRFKIDWNSKDPCGDPTIGANGGCVVDFTLEIAKRTSYPEMLYLYSNNVGQANRYLKEVTAVAGETTTTVFSATSESELPKVDPDVIGSPTKVGAYVDKTETPIVVPHGTREFSVNFKAWTTAMSVSGTNANCELNWTQQAAFIDWNNNYYFYDENENYGKSSNTIGNDGNDGGVCASFISPEGYTRTFSVPAGVQPGVYRMRVCYNEPAENNSLQWHNTIFTTDGCTTRNGKTYDFAIEILAPVYEVSVATADETMGTAEVSETEVEEGTEVTFTATPATGYRFLGWTKGTSATYVSTDATYTVAVTENLSLTANFAKQTFEVSAAPNGTNGTATVSPNGTVEYGTEVTFTATPATGYQFVNWTKGTEVVSTESTYTVTITEALSLVANFEAIPTYTITVAASPADGGTVTKSAGSVLENGTVTITATANAGYTFTGWSDGSTEPERTITVKGVIDLTANFAKQTFEVSAATNGTNGTATVSPNGTVEYGTEVTFTATPDDGYRFVNWTKGSEVVSTESTYTVTVTGNLSLTANFEVSNFTVTVSSADENMGSVTASATEVEYDDRVNVTATAKDGYYFVKWTDVDGNTISESFSYTFVVTESVELIAHFEPLASGERTIKTASNDDSKGYVIIGMSMDKNPSVTTADPVELYAATQQGCVFMNWTIDGVVVSTSQNYTYTRKKSVTLQANFNSPELQLPSGYPVVNKITTSCGNAFTESNKSADSHALHSLTATTEIKGIRYEIELDKSSHTFNNFTDTKIMNVKQGGTLTINFTVGIYTNNIWFGFDWNRDGKFDEVIAGFEGSKPSGTTEGSISVTIPEDALPGKSVMRIISDGIVCESAWNVTTPMAGTHGKGVVGYAGSLHDITLFVNNVIKSEVNLTNIQAQEENVLVTTQSPAEIVVGSETYKTTEDNLTATIPVSEGDVKIVVRGSNIVNVDCGNTLPTTHILPVKELVLRNTSAAEVAIDAPLLEKITVVSDENNNVAAVSVASDLSQGVKVVVEKTIKTPVTKADGTTPTIFNFLSMPFAFNTADIKYWDGEGWKTAIPEEHIRILMYKSDVRATQDYKNTWHTFQSTESKEIPANQGFVIVGNSDLGSTVKLQFTSATEAYDGTTTAITAKAYRKESGETHPYDTDWNINGVPYLTMGAYPAQYTLYSYDNINQEWIEDYPIDGVDPLKPYTSVMYQAGIDGDDSIDIPISTAMVADLTNSAENIFARAYISIDDTNPAKIILCDESSENFVVNEDAWYMASLNNSTPAAYFNVGGAEAKVSVQPEATELPMTVYSGAGTQHRITLAATDGNYDVYLKDAVTDEIVCLNDEDYNFTAAAKTTIANRFTVSMVEPTGIIEQAKAEGAIKAVVAGDVIKLYGTEEGDEVTLYTTGGMVITNAVAEDGVTTIETSTTGVLIIKVADQTIKVVK